MKKGKWIGKVFGIALVFLMIVGTLGSLPGFVDKVEASPAAETWDWYDLDAIRNDMSGSYVLMSDLDCTTAGYDELASPTANEGKGWQPIGNGTTYDGFIGDFHGQGYVIGDLFIDRPDEDYVGLFGCAGGVGTGEFIEDVGVVNATVTGHNYVGGLLGAFHGDTVVNCHSTGSVTGYQYVGGLLGNTGRNVDNSYFSGTVSGFRFVGGLIGWTTGHHRGRVTNCYSAGTVMGKGNVGGLVGESVGDVLNSYSTSSVTGDEYVGGLIGTNRATLVDSYSTGSVTGDGAVGGLVGYNYYLWGSVWGCYSASTVTGNHAVGGLVGSSISGVDNSYSTGSVTGYTWVGGLVGSNTWDGSVRNSHSTSSVSGDSQVGGLVGYSTSSLWDSYSTGSVTACAEVGGLVGRNLGGDVLSCYSTSRVIGEEKVGGMVGYNLNGSGGNSYATGIITRSSGENTCFGGFVGYIYGGSIVNCYSTGSVHYEDTTDPTDKGFTGGADADHDYEMAGNFWDMETSGQTSTVGNATGKTTAEMMNITTFTDTATEGLDEPWDITAVAYGETNSSYTWNIVDRQTYPFLSWELGIYIPVSIAISPSVARISVGESQTYTVEATDGDGNTFDVTAETIFTIEAGAGGCWVDNTYTSEFIGKWQVSGTHKGLTDTATLTVTLDIPTSISIWPREAVISNGSNISYIAIATDADGPTYDVTSETVFSIDADAGGAWVGNTYTSEVAGEWQVTGIYRGVTDTTVLTVTLPVPYYGQGHTEWCLLASMSMVFKYYGQNVHLWDIASDWELETGGSLSGWGEGHRIMRYFGDHGLSATTVGVDFDAVRNSIHAGNPVLLTMHSANPSGLQHAVVIVGYSELGGTKKVYIHDPSGYFVDDIPEFSEPIRVAVDWRDLETYSGWRSGWRSYALSVGGGEPSPPKGTLDLFSTHPSDHLMLTQVGEAPTNHCLSSYDRREGLIWEYSQDDPLVFGSEDMFLLVNVYLSNHTEHSMAYALEVIFIKEAREFSWRRPEDPEVNACNTTTTGGRFALGDVIGEYGEYVVTLRLSDSDCAETYDEVVFPRIKYDPRDVPTADFAASETSGTWPLIALFIDHSTEDVTSWLWDFGDGKTSTKQNPVHVYTRPGIYTVSLTVSGPMGEHTEVKEDYIEVRPWIKGAVAY